MLGKLVELSKNDSAKTIVELISLKFDNFLHRHFKRKGHTPANILVQSVEEITYDANSTSSFKIIKRHETELNFCKHHIHWDLMMKVIYRKCRILMFALC